MCQNKIAFQVVGKMMRKEGKGELPMKKQNLTDYNLLVFTLWDPWFPCSRCDARGIKTRYGTCYVKVQANVQETMV